MHTITRDIPNPQRATATTAVAAAETAVRDAKTRFADLIWQPWTDPITHLKEIGDARDNIEHTTDQLTATKTLLKAVPAKQPRQEPRARPRLERRALQTALRICAHNTEHWLAAQLDTYLQNPDEVRAITRALMHQPGTINYQPHTITVTIDQPDQPKITRALHALTQQLNTRPAHKRPGCPQLQSVCCDKRTVVPFHHHTVEKRLVAHVGVGLERLVHLSMGRFLQPALRTGRAPLDASGSPWFMLLVAQQCSLVCITCTRT